MNPCSVRILLHSLEHCLHVLDFNAEMIEPGRTPSLARIDVQTDVTIANSLRALGALLRGRFHLEDCLVKAGEQSIILTDNGDVIDLGEHFIALTSWADAMLS